MIFRELVAFAGIVLPLVLSLLGLDARLVAWSPSLAPLIEVLPWVSIGLALLLVLALAVRVFSLAREVYYRVIPSTLENVALRPIQAQDIPKIVEIARASIGEQINVDGTRSLYLHNSLCIQKVVDTRNREILGYFCVLPLTEVGEKRVMERDLIGATVDVSCFAKRFSKRMPVYIGSIAGVGRRGRAATLELLKTFLVNKEVHKAYTRPVSKDGV